MFPRFSQWKTPSLPFSFRAGLRSEIYSLAAVVASMYLLNIIEIYAVEDRLRTDRIWNVVLVCTLVAYFVLRHLRKHTRLLNERGSRVET
jgi:hypothetical protein